MIVELRIYHCTPGSMPALHQRLSMLTEGKFKQHGIKPVGFWNALVGPSNNALTYMLEWKNLAEREEKWNAFQADPEWRAYLADAALEKPILERVESSFLVPTDYSPMR